MKTDLKMTLIASTDFYDKSKDPSIPKINHRADYTGGLAAGICYMKDDLDALRDNPRGILVRANGTMESGHHSVFDHSWITIYLENIPKLFAMLLNNEKWYDASEKSARYTKMNLPQEEQDIYDKWLVNFKRLIYARYGDEKYFDEDRIEKLAQENARLFTSIYTPTNMFYSTSYRQFNYLYHWIKTGKAVKDDLFAPIADRLKDFCAGLEELGIYNEKLADDRKDRDFSLLAKYNFGKVDGVARDEYFGDFYSVNYLGSWSHLAQTQRHKTTSDEAEYDPNASFFVNPMVREEKSLLEEYMADMDKLRKNRPQGQLVKINERAKVEDLILKAKERCCTAAQYETNHVVASILQRYLSDHTTPEHLKAAILPYTKGSRCTFPDFKCPQKTPCGFKDGIYYNDKPITRKI